MQQGSIKYRLRLESGMVSQSIRKSSNLGRVELVGRKKTAIEETVGFERILRQRVVQSRFAEGRSHVQEARHGCPCSRYPEVSGGFLEFLPGEGAFFDPSASSADALGKPGIFQEPSRGHPWVGESSPLAIARACPGSQVGHNEVSLRVGAAKVTDYAFHPQDTTLVGMPGILVVIDRKLKKE